MSELKFTEEELAAMFAEAPDGSPSDDLLNVLAGRPADARSLSLPVASERGIELKSASLVSGGGGDGTGEYSWLRAIHLVPAHRQLILRYPAIGLKRHSEHGIVLMAAYLEDTLRRVRRNLMLDGDLFFHADALEATEPDTKAIGCRIVIKTIRHRVGMRIRFWQNEAQGDALGKSGTYEVRESGLQLLTRSKAGKR